jgi:hypothetical protein
MKKTSRYDLYFDKKSFTQKPFCENTHKEQVDIDSYVKFLYNEHAENPSYMIGKVYEVCDKGVMCHTSYGYYCPTWDMVKWYYATKITGKINPTRTKYLDGPHYLPHMDASLTRIVKILNVNYDNFNVKVRKHDTKCNYEYKVIVKNEKNESVTILLHPDNEELLISSKKLKRDKKIKLERYKSYKTILNNILKLL